MNSKRSNFTHSSSTIKHLFESSINLNKNYEIPLYQRLYTWDEEHLIPLLEDIYQRSQDQNEHYFGVLAVTDNLEEVDNEKREWIRVIDGQQRITTSILIIHILKLLISEEEENEKEQGFFNIFKNVYFKNELSTKVSEDINKIVTHEAHRISFESKKIKSNIDIIKTFLKDKEWNYKDILNTFLNKFKLVKLEYNIKKEEEMLVFENLNSKGSPLNEFDLIRNLIISINKDEEPIKNLQFFNKFITNILRNRPYNLSEEKAHFTFEKFLESYLKWKMNFESYKSYPLYKNFKKYISKNSISFTDILKECEKFLSLFLSINNKEGKLSKKLWFRTSKKDITMPFLYEVFNKNSSFDDDKKEWKWNKDIDNFVKVLSIHLIKLISVEGTGQSLGTLIQKLTKRVLNNDTYLDIKKYLNFGEDVPSGNTPSNDRFKESFNKRQTQKWIPKAIIDIIEFETHELGEKIDYNGRTLEHILPQKPNETIWNINLKDEKFKNYINRIGNYAFLNNISNIKVGNKSFSVKKENYYIKSMSPLLKNDYLCGIKVKPVISYDNWGTDEIDKRTKELSEVAIKIME